MSQVQQPILTLFDRFLLEMPNVLSRFDEVCLIHIYDVFLRGWKIIKRDTGPGYYPSRADRHIIVKISRQLWETGAVNSSSALRERFVSSLALFCEQFSYGQFSTPLNFRADSHFLGALGHGVIPYIINTALPDTDLPRYNLGQFRATVYGNTLLFSDYIKEAPLMTAIRFLVRSSFNPPRFVLDNEGAIVDLFEACRSSGRDADCAMIAHFLHDNDSLSILRLSDENLIDYVLAEALLPLTSERSTLASFMALFLRDHETTVARISWLVRSFRAPFFSGSNELQDSQLCAMTTDVALLSQVLSQSYARAPDDPNSGVIRVQRPDPVQPAPRAVTFGTRFLAGLVRHATTSLFVWCRALCWSYGCLFEELPDSLTEDCFRVAFDALIDIDALYSGHRPPELFQRTIAILRFMEEFLSHARRLDLFYRWVFGQLREFKISQISFLLILIEEHLTDYDTALLVCCVLTAHRFAAFVPDIIERLRPGHQMSFIVLCKLSSVCQSYFSTLIKAYPDMLRAYQQFVDTTDWPFSEFGEFPRASPRDVRALHSTGFSASMLASEFQFVRLAERDFFSQPMDLYRAPMRVTFSEDDEIEIPDGISAGEWPKLSPRARAEAVQALLPPATVDRNPAIWLYLLRQPPWIRAVVNGSGGLMNPSNYLRLIDVYHEMAKLKDFDCTGFRSRDDILADVLCGPRLFDVMIPIVGKKEWRPPNPEETFPRGGPLFTIGPSIRQTEKSFALFLEAALRYPPVVDVAITALQKQFNTLPAILKPLKFFAQHVTQSQSFERFFVEEVLDQALTIDFRTNPVLMKRLATLVIRYCGDDEKPKFSARIGLLMLFFFLDGGERTFEGALKIAASLNEDTKRSLASYVHYFFEDCRSDNSSAGKVRWMKICRLFRFFIADAEPTLVAELDNLLGHYRPNKISEIGALLDILVPKRPPAPVAENLAIDVPLNIAPSLYAEAPAFWNVVAKHQLQLTDITRAHSELVTSSLAFVVRYPVLLDVMLKISLFQQVLRGDKPHSEVSWLQVVVNRSTIVSDSLKAVGELSRDRLFDQISVTFRGEEGVDIGGITRDWFGYLSVELFGASTNLFVPTANGRSLQVNRLSGTNPDTLRLFRFCGKFMALAMVHGIPISAHLTSSLYKFLIGANLTLRDMEQIDETVARSIKKILDDPVDCLMLDFTVGAEEDGKPISLELKPGGADIAVCEANKLEYVQLRLNYYFRTYASVQISAFLEGFFELIPQEKLALFTADELDLVICGIPEIDVEDLQKNCHVIEPYTRRHPVVQTFFNVLRGWKTEDLVRLLQFVTGSSHVPAGGFATLAEQGRPFAIAPGGAPDRLPAAHVCTNQLDLPDYPSEELMNQKLLWAVRNCSGFGKA
jgi:hypothetical protein